MRHPRLPLTVWVAAGSALGASLRWGAGGLQHTAGPLIGMPWSTLAVNVLGSLAIGLYAALAEPGGRLVASPAQRLFVMAGLCGGFTTFSLFTAEVLGCIERGEWKQATLLVVASSIAWLMAVAAGYAWGKHLNRLSRTTR